MDPIRSAFSDEGPSPVCGRADALCETSRSLFDLCPDPVLLCDVAETEHDDAPGVFVREVNPAGRLVLSVGDGSRKSRPIAELIPELGAPEVRAALCETHRSGEPAHLCIATSGLAGEGEPRWCTVSATPLPTGVAVALRDMTTEKRLGASLALARETLDRAGDCVLWVSPEGAVADANRTAGALLGWDRAELLGKNAWTIGVSPSPAAWAEAWRSLHQQAAVEERELLRADGRRVPVSLSTHRVSIGGGEFAIVMARDITERRRSMEDLRSTLDAALSGARAKNEFLANMSHEIRTPMSAILGYADLLTDVNLSEEDRRDAVEVIQRNGRSLLTLINEVLDLSRIEAGRMELDRADCAPAAIVADVASTMRVRAGEKGVAMRTRFDGPVPATIRTDAARLRQILMNLVGNAVKFTDSGEIVIGLRFERVGRIGRLVFDVSDTGSGMNDEVMERIFLPFCQADASTTRVHGGAGLGLAISRRLARLLGGDLSATSHQGLGSVFTLTLDLGPADAVELLGETGEAMRAGDACHAPPLKHDAEPHRVQTLAGAHVLVAEDGPDNQRLIRAFLQGAGAQVTVASDGVEAVAAAAQRERSGAPFDLILMDMQMPHMDGYAATRTLRDSACRTPVIALTAHAMEGDREKCLGAGCDDYLSKPVDRRDLVRVCAEWLSGKGSHPPSPLRGEAK